MSAILNPQPTPDVPTSCGTLIINPKRQILLCHVTNSVYWDIPKGRKDGDEGTLPAAIRELREETGLSFDADLFAELGAFQYGPMKRLHLYMVRSPASLDSLEHLVCTSHFKSYSTGKMVPEMDGYRWATREDVPKLCRPRMAERLLSFDW